MQGRTAVAQELTSLAWNLGKLKSDVYTCMIDSITTQFMMSNIIFCYNLLLCVVVR